jgi:hypothetical protein
MSPAMLFLAVKLLELAHHSRPRRLLRLFFHPDKFLRRQFRWTALHIGAVWFGEIAEWVFRRRARSPRQLREWLDEFGYGEEQAASPAPPAFIPLSVTVRRPTARVHEHASR